MKKKSDKIPEKNIKLKLFFERRILTGYEGYQFIEFFFLNKLKFKPLVPTKIDKKF